MAHAKGWLEAARPGLERTFGNGVALEVAVWLVVVAGRKIFLVDWDARPCGTVVANIKCHSLDMLVDLRIPSAE